MLYLKHAIDKSLPSYVDERVLKASAEAEWATLRKKIRRIGVYRTLHFDNPTTACVVDMMGEWSALRTMSVTELSFRYKDCILETDKNFHITSSYDTPNIPPTRRVEHLWRREYIALWLNIRPHTSFPTKDKVE